MAVYLEADSYIGPVDEVSIFLKENGQLCVWAQLNCFWEIIMLNAITIQTTGTIKFRFI